MTISLANKKKDVRFDGGLKEGSKGTEYLCLPKESTCMHVDVLGGEWGNEVSWEIRTMREGAPTIAGGSSPMSCDFSVGGEACENTCSGKPNIAPNSDPDYKEFKDMYTCIEDHCTIQVGVCEKDVTCALCLTEEKGDFCYGSEAFISVVDCTVGVILVTMLFYWWSTTCFLTNSLPLCPFPPRCANAQSERAANFANPN